MASFTACRATASSGHRPQWRRQDHPSRRSSAREGRLGTVDVGDTVKISYVDQSRGGIDPNQNRVGGRLRHDYINVGSVEIPRAPAVVSSASRVPTSRRRPASSPVASGTASTLRSPSRRAATCCSSMSRPTTSTSRRWDRWTPWSFPGCAVVISHDRWFLDRVATHILPTRAPMRTPLRGTGSKGTSSPTRPTRWSASARRRAPAPSDLPQAHPRPIHPG